MAGLISLCNRHILVGGGNCVLVFFPRENLTIYIANDRQVSRTVCVEMCMYNDFHNRIDHDL